MTPKLCPWCHKPDPLLSENDILGEAKMYCFYCGLSGPWMPSPSKAEAAWNALPRKEWSLNSPLEIYEMWSKIPSPEDEA